MSRVSIKVSVKVGTEPISEAHRPAPNPTELEPSLKQVLCVMLK